MGLQANGKTARAPAGPVLHAYLLGPVDFEAALGLQRRLVYQVSGKRSDAALILCEHPPLITVGRSGSRAHILYEPAELAWRGWPVRWVNRGGGCQLHLPGQLAVYPVVALDFLGLGLRAYLDRLQDVLVAVLADFQIRGETRPDIPGVWVGERPVALTGAAVQSWVSYYGAVLNVCPDLEPFRRVRTPRPDDRGMTSMERERKAPLRPALVRERLLEHFSDRFDCRRVSLFHDHALLCRRAPSDAIAARP
jgi:lipoyl(octanoyl) transferase